MDLGYWSLNFYHNSCGFYIIDNTMLQIMVMIWYFHKGDPASQIMGAFEKLGNKMEKKSHHANFLLFLAKLCHQSLKLLHWCFSFAFQLPLPTFNYSCLQKVTNHKYASMSFDFIIG